MGDWWELCWWAGGALAAMALVVMSLALFRDRSRGRRRCPRCWYDMSGVGGMQCPECGRTQAAEKRFFRTRQNWRRVVLGAGILVAAGATALAPAVVTGQWSKFTPAPVLRGVLSFFKNDAEEVGRKLMGAGAVTTLTTWERLLLASDLSRDLRSYLKTKPTEAEAGRGLVLGGRVGTPFGAPARRRQPGQRRTLDELQGEASALGDEYRPMLPELLQAFRSSDDSLSVLAARTFEALGPKAASATPAFREGLLEGKSVGGRQTCLRVLLAFNAKDAETIQSLRGMALGDADLYMRYDATMVLAILEPDGRATMDAILDLLRTGLPGHRSIAVNVLGWYAGADAGAAPSLNRFDTYTWAGSTPLAPTVPPNQDERLIGAIAGALRDPEAVVRLDAALILGELQTRVAEVLGELRRGIEVETNDVVKRTMISAYVSDEKADIDFILQGLIERLGAENEEGRDWAASMLASCGARAASAAPSLRRAVLEDVGVRADVYCMALESIGSEGLRVLEELARLEKPERSEAARRALERAAKRGTKSR